VNITYDDIVEWTPEYRQRMLDWLAANGVDGNKVRADTGLAIDQGYIGFQEWVLNGNGRVQMRPDGTDAWSEPRVVPVVTALPPQGEPA